MENRDKNPNILIAEFMGVRVYPENRNEHKNWVDIHTGKKGWKGQACDVEHFQLNYDKSWDALMPCVHKFLNISPDEFNYHVSNMTALSIWKGEISTLSITSTIGGVYTLLTEAITWYLSQTPNPKGGKDL